MCGWVYKRNVKSINCNINTSFLGTLDTRRYMAFFNVFLFNLDQHSQEQVDKNYPR